MSQHYSIESVSIIVDKFKKQIEEISRDCQKKGSTSCGKIGAFLKEIKAFKKFCARQIRYWQGYYQHVSNASWNKCFYNIKDLVNVIELFEKEGDCDCGNGSKRARVLGYVTESVQLMGHFFKNIVDNNNDESLDWPISKNITKVIKQSKSAVVFIRTMIRKEEKSEDDLFFDLFGEEFKDKYFKEDTNSISDKYQEATGTGFLISKDGYILTNNHVIDGGEKLTVEIYGEEKKEFEATVVGTDPSTDVALLKIKRKNCTFLTFANSDFVEEGQWTIAIGHPFRMKFTSTTGIVSAVHRTDLDISQVEDYIQTDAAINPGNSGGPLLNLKGQVIGMNTAILTEGGGSIGLGFAVPSNLCQSVLEILKKDGKINRARLGVHLQDIDEDLKIAFKLKNKVGAIISDVAPGSSGFVAGLKDGDIITEFDDEKVKDSKHLSRLIAKKLVGQSVQLQLIRNTKTLDVTVKMITFFDPDHEVRKNKRRYISDKVGLGLEHLSSMNKRLFGLETHLKGLVITYVKENSIASKAKLKPGTIIMKMSNESVFCVDELESRMRKASKKKPIVLHVLYRGKKSFITLTLPKVR